MPTKKIFLFSANCEYGALSDYQLNIVKQKIDAKDPDIIVLALQEAVSEGGALPKRMFRLLNSGVDYNDSDGHVYSSPVTYHHDRKLRKKMTGSTKAKKGFNYVQLSVLHKGGSAPTVKKTFSGKSDPLKGKGGVGVYLQLNGKHIAFVGCHLESSDGKYDSGTSAYKPHKDKKAGVKNTLDDLVGQSGQALANFHSIFLMGDLNFRLLKNPALPAKTVAEMATSIENETGRLPLWALDSLNDANHGGFLTAAAPGGYGFTFPQPTNPLYYPTYKRAYKKSQTGAVDAG